MLRDMADIYSGYVGRFVELLKQSPEGEISRGVVPERTLVPLRQEEKPCALLLSSHPDDECLTGGLALRLKQEAGWQIVNVSITLGGDLTRRNERWAELTQACSVLGFDVMAMPDDFPGVSPNLRAGQPALWHDMASFVAGIIENFEPRAVFLPHSRDLHSTHIGTHFLGMDALALLPSDFSCFVAQTEWWQPNEEPNRLIGLGVQDAGLLLQALCRHAGEVERNPYHKRFPAYLIDNVRRGSERVMGQRAEGAAVDLAMLYRVDKWVRGKPEALQGGRVIRPDQGIDRCFQP